MMNTDDHFDDGHRRIPLEPERDAEIQANAGGNCGDEASGVNAESVEADENTPLPDLNEAILDRDTLDQLFRDLEACVRITEIIPKFADRRMVAEETVTLAQARELLLDGKARGVQIRYRYEDADWWDTLMNTPQGVRLVRIRHEFD